MSLAIWTSASAIAVLASSSAKRRNAANSLTLRGAVFGRWFNQFENHGVLRPMLAAITFCCTPIFSSARTRLRISSSAVTAADGITCRRLDFRFTMEVSETC